MQQQKVIIYQLLVRLAGNKVNHCKPWGTIEENGCGKFDDLTPHFLQQIADLGATHVWLTGIQEHASCTAYPEHDIAADNPLVVKGRAGSPYAIKDYYDVAPDLANNVEKRMEEFEALLERCRDNGLTPVIDFVPNHVARQYHSDQKQGKANQLGQHDDTGKAFDPSNNFYYIPDQPLKLPEEVFRLPTSQEMKTKEYHEFPAKVTGNDCFSHEPRYQDWYETIKLNYGVDYQNNQQTAFDPVPDTWHKMLDILLFWAKKGVGGFRCDMAEMVPEAFWRWAITAVKKVYPNLLFIAEIYNPDAYSRFTAAGFDYLYDKEGLYNTLRDIMTGERPAADLTSVWHKLGGQEGSMLRFIENHDEKRIASETFAGTASAGIPGMTVAATMHQGPCMVYFGQETGEEAKGAAGFSGDDGRTSIFDYCHVPRFQKWYQKGKCNNDQLSDEEKALRTFYRQLFNLCQEPVIRSGHFYDLMWNNRHLNHQHIYTYLRWDQQAIWLIATNFSHHEHMENQIYIPAHFREISGHNTDKQREPIPLLTLCDSKQIRNITSTTMEINVCLPPLSAEILHLKEQ